MTFPGVQIEAGGPGSPYRFSFTGVNLEGDRAHMAGLRHDGTFVCYALEVLSENVPAPPIDPSAIIGPAVYLGPATTHVFLDQIDPVRDDREPRVVTELWSDKETGAEPYFASGRNGVLKIDAAKCGSTLIVSRRPLDNPSRRWEKTLTVYGPRAAARAAPITVHWGGDSIANRQGPRILKEALLSFGWPGVTFAGTVPSAYTLSPSDDSGELGEYRESRSGGDDTYAELDGDTPAPVPPGDEAVYMARPKAEKLTFNPALVAGVGANARNGQLYDLDGYFVRYDLPVPDIIIDTFGRNDERESGSNPTLAANRIEDHIRVKTAQIRLWDATKPIVYAQFPQARSVPGDADWACDKAMLLRAIAVIEELRATDPNVHLWSAWAHMPASAGWAVADGQISDEVHPITIARRMAFGVGGLAVVVDALAP